MSLASAISEIEYPESDGRPMGETDLHRYWMNRIYDLLVQRLAGQQAYVGCDLLVYYVEGLPYNFCVPDVFVSIGAKPGFRRTFKVWEEGRPPTVVFEVTSASTRRDDEVFKPRTYAQIGVDEYFLFDPTADYLSSQLLGFRLERGVHVPISADSTGGLACERLGLRLSLEGSSLVLADAASGKPLLTEAEAAEARADEANERADEAEEEIRRLKEQLAKLQAPDES